MEQKFIWNEDESQNVSFEVEMSSDLIKRCPNCNHSWTNGVHDVMNSDFNLKKVDFFWINREQKAFEWFLQLLSQLEMEQAEEYEDQLKGLSSNFLDIHLYMTSFSPNKDINAMALKLALDLMHIKVCTSVSLLFKK